MKRRRRKDLERMRENNNEQEAMAVALRDKVEK